MRNKIQFFMAALAVIFCFCGSATVAYAGGGEEVSDETAATETQEEAATEKESNPFTPAGTGTVVDTATNEDGKQFYTITTPAGNIFYLIIDLERNSDNVYFLDAVTEKDLLALAAQVEGADTSESTTTGTTPEAPAVSEPLPEDSEDTSDAQTEPSSGGVSGSLVFILIAVLAAGGIGYYFKIYKPKQQSALDDEFDEEYEDEDGDDFEEYSNGELEDGMYGEYPLEEDRSDSEPDFTGED